MFRTNQKGEIDGGLVLSLLLFALVVWGIVAMIRDTEARHEARLAHLSHFQKKTETIVKLKPIKTQALNRRGQPVWLGKYAFKRVVPATATAKPQVIWFEYDFYMPDDSYARYGSNVPYGGTWSKSTTPPEEEVEEEAAMQVEEEADAESDPSTEADADSSAEGDSGSESGGDSDGGGDSGGDSGGGDGGGGDGGGGGD